MAFSGAEAAETAEAESGAGDWQEKNKYPVIGPNSADMKRNFFSVSYLLMGPCSIE